MNCTATLNIERKIVSVSSITLFLLDEMNIYHLQNTRADWQSCLLKDQSLQAKMKLTQLWIWRPLSCKHLDIDTGWLYLHLVLLLSETQTPVPVQFEEEISFCGAKDAVE